MTSKRNIKVLIVDDHPIFREGLRMVLDAEKDLSICGEAGQSAEALDLIQQSKPDVALVDLTLDQSNGLELLKDIRVRWKSLPVIILTNHDEALYAERCIRAGANGYLMKHNPPEQLIAAIHDVLNGGVSLSESMKNQLLTKVSATHQPPKKDLAEELSDRELQVFELYGKGKSTREIAEILHLSVKTVETHREHIKAKLNFKDGNTLMRAAFQWVERQSGL